MRAGSCARFLALALFALLLVAGPSILATSAHAAAPVGQVQAAPDPEQEEEELAPEGEEPVVPEGEEELIEEEVTAPVPEPEPESVPPPPSQAAPPPSSAPIVIRPPTPATVPPPPPAAAASPTPAPMTETPPAAPVTTTAAPAPTAVAPAPTEKPVSPLMPMPESLRKTTARLAASPLINDPIAAGYLGRLATGEPTAEDVNGFAVLLARKTFLRDAAEFAEAAVKMDKSNTDYWLNLGTVRLQQGKLSKALVAYEKALKLDANLAITHYDIGVVHDYMRNYDKAVDSFARALALDPTLGDPKVNPLAVNNNRLLVVGLLLYQAKEGGLAMPLRGGPPAKPTAAKQPAAAKKSGS